ncbi:Zinc finger, C2H2 type [Popillia japonica]|uniref:Zinc finger, C2H2 type n=1 Tax=Popillia japonica TaxID=7064 RepID=A0AAW1KH77_POPJA
MDKNYVDIFEHHERNKVLFELLMECIPIKIDKSDGLPIHMCTDCTEKLCEVWYFKSMVLDSALKLQMREVSELPLASAGKANNTSTSDDNQHVSCDVIIKDEIVIKHEDTDLPLPVDIIKINDSTNKIEEVILSAFSNVEERNELSESTLRSNIIGGNKNLGEEINDVVEPPNTEDSGSNSSDYKKMLIGKEGNQIEKCDNNKNSSYKKDLEYCNDETEKQICNYENEKCTSKDSIFDEDGLPIIKDGRQLTRKEKLKMYINSIFEHHKRNKVLSELLMECVPIKIDKSDGLPIYICTDCTERLCEVWDFKSMVLASALKLQMRKDSELPLASAGNTNVKSNVSLNEENQQVPFELIIKDEVVIKDEDTDLPLAVGITKINNSTNEIEEVTLSETAFSKVDEQNELSESTLGSNIIGENKNFWEESSDMVESNTEDSDSNSSDYINMLIGKESNRIEKCDNSKTSTAVKDPEHCSDETKKETCNDQTEKCMSKDLECDDDGLPIMKDGRKLTRKEKLKMTVFFCGKVFATRINVRAHQKRHAQVKPHVCTHCGKAFGESATLKVHSLVHTGEKPHSCNICGKKFRQIACLPKHMRIHTGETPFPCELCPSRFKYKHHLQNHMKVHKS